MNAFDVIIIGFGKGGKTLAAEFAKRGQKVAIIERSDKMYGGTCINIGCIPTKTLVHQAKMASALKDATFEERSEFYRNAVSVKESVTSALRNKNYHNLADNPNVTVYTLPPVRPLPEQAELLRRCLLYQKLWQGHIGAQGWAVTSGAKEGQ